MSPSKERRRSTMPQSAPWGMKGIAIGYGLGAEMEMGLSDRPILSPNPAPEDPCLAFCFPE
jgi:hypothetical protein